MSSAQSHNGFFYYVRPRMAEVHVNLAFMSAYYFNLYRFYAFAGYVNSHNFWKISRINIELNINNNTV